MYLTRGLTRVRFVIFFLDIFFDTFKGARSTPATKAWPKGLAFDPSSKTLTPMAFLPVHRPPGVLNLLLLLLGLLLRHKGPALACPLGFGAYDFVAVGLNPKNNPNALMP